MEYPRQLLEEIHKLNHTHSSNVIFTNMTSILDVPPKYVSYDANYNIIIKNLIKGVYKIILDSKYYVFILYETLKNNNSIIIYSSERAFVVTNNNPVFLKLYLLDSMMVQANNSYTIGGTVNSYFDKIHIEGRTNLVLHGGEQTPLNPATLNSTYAINLISHNSDKSKTDSIEIKLNKPLKYLTNQVCDDLITDLDANRATILFRVGRLVVSGNEDWKKVEELSTATYSVFFLKYDLIKISDSAESILCNYFPSTNNSSIRNGSKTPYCISCSDDIKNRGIYITILNETIKGKDAITFKNYLRTLFGHNPVIIDYELDTYAYNIQLLGEYKLKTFYPKTLIEMNYPTKIACYSKTVTVTGGEN